MGPVVLALGFFDGLHIGHQTVIQQALQLAHEGEARMCVITFDIPPRAVLRPEHPVQLLETRQEKIRKLEKMGVDTVVFIHPTVEVLSETAEEAILLLEDMQQEVLPCFLPFSPAGESK